MRVTRRPRSVTTFAALVATAALVLAGCSAGPSQPTAAPPQPNGVENLSADEIMAQAAAALSSTSFRMTLEPAPDSFVAPADLVYAGQDVMGTVGRPPGAEVEVVVTGGTLYLKGDTAFWTANLFFLQPDLGIADPRIPALAAEAAGAWIAVPAEPYVDVVSPLLRIESLFAAPMLVRPLTKGAASSIDGVRVIEVTDADGAVFSVALDGPPYLVKITEAGGTATLTEIGQAAAITPPEGARDLAQLLAALG